VAFLRADKKIRAGNGSVFSLNNSWTKDFQESLALWFARKNEKRSCDVHDFDMAYVGCWCCHDLLRKN